MHPDFERADRLSREVIGAAIEVHRIMGPGLLESIYEKCLCHELTLRGLQCVNQQWVTVRYKTMQYEEELRFDVLVEGCLLVEIKAVQEMPPIFQAKLLSYMKLRNVPLRLLINFHELRLVDGVKRMILPGAGRPVNTTN
jgi:GxxExxY protein